jgi:hypothetical protein
MNSDLKKYKASGKRTLEEMMSKEDGRLKRKDYDGVMEPEMIVQDSSRSALRNLFSDLEASLAKLKIRLKEEKAEDNPKLPEPTTQLWKLLEKFEPRRMRVGRDAGKLLRRKRSGVRAVRLMTLVKVVRNMKNTHMKLSGITKAYNMISPNRKASVSSVRRAMVQEMGMRCRRVAYRGPNYFTVQNKLGVLVYLVILLELRQRGTEFMFLDESSYSRIKCPRKAWIGPGEESKARSRAFNGKMNLLVCCTEKEILFKDKFVTNTNNKVIKDKIKLLADTMTTKEKESSVLILDNATYHHHEDVKEQMWKGKLRVLFTPKYTPELNMVEFIFGATKAQLRDKDFKSW